MKTTGKAIRSAALIVAGLAVPAVGISLLLGAAGDGEDPAYEANRRKIESMSRERRSRLQRNYDQFLALSESERDKYREFHRAIEDDAREGGELRVVLRRYNDWLKTLLPFQREELRTKPPAARMALIADYTEEQRRERWVRSLPDHQQRWLRREDDPEKRKVLEERFRREQERKQADRAPVAPGSFSTYSYWGSSSHRDLKLCRDDFEAVMAVVESSVQVPDERRDELASATKAQRHLLVLLEAVTQPSGRPESTGRLNWPDDELLERMVATISRDELRERIAAEEPESRRLLMVRLIVRGFLSEWWEQNAPDEDELRDFFENLDQREQDRITNLTGSWQKRALTRRYFEEHTPAYSDEFREFYWTDFMRTFRRLSGYSGHSGRRRVIKMNRGDAPKSFERRDTRESKAVEPAGPVEAPRPPRSR